MTEYPVWMPAPKPTDPRWEAQRERLESAWLEHRASCCRQGVECPSNLKPARWEPELASLQADYEKLLTENAALTKVANDKRSENIDLREQYEAMEYEAMEARLLAHHNIGDQLTVADWGKTCHICAALHRMKGETK